MKNDAIHSKIGGKIRSELQLGYLFKASNVLPSLISGALVGFMTTLLSISFAVLVFGKAIPEALPIGIGMALFSNLILHVCAALGSSGEGVIYHVQSLPPPLQAMMLASIMSTLPASVSTEDRTVIAVVVLSFSAVFTGAVLFFLGHLKLGRLVRLLPLPVISGFLASVGIALVMGGMKTMVGGEGTLSNFFNITFLFKWLPGIVLTIVLWFATIRWKHKLVMPYTLGIAVLLFYAICTMMGLTIADMTAEQLLLGPFKYHDLWQSPTIYYRQLHLVDWTIVASQIGTLATMPLVCFIGGLLMLSAIEFSTGRAVEPNFDLKTMGISNLLSGITGGGFMGYPSTTFTLLQHQLGASTRLSGLLSALIPLIVLSFGAHFLSLMPRFVVGGLLIYFGYQFIDYWIIKQFKQATLPHLSIIGSIVITSLWFNFVASVGVGLVVAVSFFLFNYSQTNVLRYVSTGRLLRSRLARNAAQEAWLSTHGDHICVFGLQGYIFFGTAYNLQKDILARVADPNQMPVHCVIFDFRYMTGIDASVVEYFHKLYLELNRKEIIVLFAEVPPPYQGLMQKMSFMQAFTEGFIELVSLDEALEWSEDYLLKKSGLPSNPTRSLFQVFTEYFSDSSKAAILLNYFKRLELPSGFKIIEQNTVAYDLFFLESGRLSTYSEEAGRPPIRLETIVDETIVGEVSFYLGQLRIATIITEEPSIVYRLSMDALTQMENEHPIVAMAFHRLIIQKIAQRLTNVNKNVKRLL